MYWYKLPQRVVSLSVITGKNNRKEKNKLILELRQEHPEVKLKPWLELTTLPKSSFYEWMMPKKR